MMNSLKTFDLAQTTDTVHVLGIEDLEVVSGGVNHTALDPTNPLCPGPRWHPDFGNHVPPPKK